MMPTTHQRPTAQAFQGALGDVEDSLIDRAKQAVKASYPLLAPPDALTAIGAEMQLPQGPNEGTAAYAARLADAFSLWPWAGTPFGLLRALWDAGYTNAVLAQVVGAKQYTLDASGNLVISSGGSWTPTFAGDPFWARFDLIFPSPLPASWQTGGVPAVTSAEAQYIMRIIQLWKPGYARLRRVIAQTGGAIWGYPATATWGTGTWGGTEVVWGTGKMWGVPAEQVWGTATGTYGGGEIA